MDTAGAILLEAHHLYARNSTSTNPEQKQRPPVYKAIGISLAISSGLFIGTSFVLKKKGLLKANEKYNEEAGEGYGYLKNAFWWTGMTLMIIGEICNFVAYAFVDAILVTPLGALSVVVTTILSAIFLKERLSFVGKVACFLCIIGSVVIVVNAPQQSSVADIQQMKGFVVAPGFLSYAGVVILGCAFIAIWAGPRYGKKSMLVYLSICSLIGGLSVVSTQGLGSAIIAQAGGEAQFNQWFLYLVLVFVITTLVTEIIYLNKALNIFNAALVTPTYYVFFTSSTIVTSAILFRGFKGTVVDIINVVMGFLIICAGVILLQLSKSAKDVPDTAVFAGDLDQVRTVAEQEQPESEPKADAIRGTAALIRRISMSRRKMEEEEAKRLHAEKQASMESIGEDEEFVWDGLRRRRTTLGGPHPGSLRRRKTLHPPLGLTKFPTEDDDEEAQRNQNHGDEHTGPSMGIIGSIRSRAKSAWIPGQRKDLGRGNTDPKTPTDPVPLGDIHIPPYKAEDQHGSTTSFPPMPRSTSDFQDVPLPPPHAPHIAFDASGGSSRISPRGSSARPLTETLHDPTLPPRSQGSLAPDELRGPTAKRQFSFQNVFHRNREAGRKSRAESEGRPTSRIGLHSRQGSSSMAKSAVGGGTEEERLGLVKGDSSAMLPLPDYTSEEEGYGSDGKAKVTPPSSDAPTEGPTDEEKLYEDRRKKWAATRTAEESPSPVKRKQTEEERRKDDAEMKDWERRQGRGPDDPGSFI